MLYVLLGMHKSGTTLLSQILHDSGIHMGSFDESKGYDEGNKYERLETHDLNIEMLGYDYKELSINIATVVQDSATIKPEILSKIKSFIAAQSAQSQDWGFKDPRTCLTYHIWEKVLPPHKLIAIFRHPSELWGHYRRASLLHVLMNISRCWKALHAWYIHNIEILKIIKAREGDYYLAEYHAFMTEDRMFKKFCDFTGRPLKDCRNPGMYRSKINNDFLFNLMLWIQKSFFARDIMALYEELKKLVS